ncbi:porin family protein [Runella sp.]|uniref:porin family protein n=1 Tax=Runella sp. TaxID=1960881 RepID=UPI003D0DE468
MKKVFVILSILSAFSYGKAIAQENVSFGPIVGVNFSKLTGNQIYNDWKTGATAGIFINYSGESRFGVNGQILYSRIGGQSSNGASKGHLDYIQIPIMGTYYLNGRGNQFRPKLMLGPYIGFLAKATNESGISINPEGSTRPYKGVDAGAAMGLGFNYSLSRKVWLNADLRYNLGLAQVMNTVDDVHNRSWGINVGLSFPLGKYSPSTGTLR